MRGKVVRWGGAREQEATPLHCLPRYDSPIKTIKANVIFSAFGACGFKTHNLSISLGWGNQFGVERQAQSSLSCFLCLAVLDKAGDMVVTKTVPSPALRGSRTVHQNADQCQSWEGLAKVEGSGPGWIPHFWVETLGL